MKAPGTANPHDDQPADMDGYVDGGDVHTNSGIPNRAFYVTATHARRERLGRRRADLVRGAARHPAQPDRDVLGVRAADRARTRSRPTAQPEPEADAVTAGWDAVKVPL